MTHTDARDAPSDGAMGSFWSQEAPLTEEASAADAEAELSVVTRERSFQPDALAPILPTRVATEDVKQAVNTVLMPRYLKHHAAMADARKKLKRGEITPVEMKAITHASGREFDTKYAQTIEAAKAIANADGEVPLQRLVSSDASWAAVELQAQMIGKDVSQPFRPGLTTIESGAPLSPSSPARPPSSDADAPQAFRPSDPPLAEQLRPLPTAELARRALRRLPGAALEPRHDQVLAAAVRAYEHQPRAEVRRRGEPLPPALATALVDELRALRWDRNQRPALQSDGYLVLNRWESPAAGGTGHPHYELRRLCDEVLTFARARGVAAPGFAYTAIAVTRSFVGSPHIDTFDTAEQLAVALGDFEGGELCVESADGDAIEVVETRGAVASVDGRRVHWARTFRGERFSLIWYTTE